MSIISIPCSAASAMCFALSRFARSPPCTMGCSVLTRPSIISGNWVTSSIGVTGTPASAMTRAVPPVEMICAPNSSCSAFANSTTPVLSVTDIRTRLTWGFSAMLSSFLPCLSAGMLVCLMQPLSTLDAVNASTAGPDGEKKGAGSRRITRSQGGHSGNARATMRRPLHATAPCRHRSR